ncbi:unnamed protein product [Clonostachys rosea f. rosea IK726]|uniref:Uncharacterized protein n=2 Tax=Bionectria ochroleuca TaxID=29856 RepID=A0A0B7K664_BIOOC|nr:unnamed protein product [Clonostachys rosea f. rosea IK726]
MGASTDDAKVNRQEQPQSQQGEHREHSDHRKTSSATSLAESAVKFSLQAQKLSLEQPQQTNETPASPAESHLQHPSAVATQAHFVTPHDPVIITSDGNRLPGVPLEEAHKLNSLRDELEGQPGTIEIKEAADGKTVTNTSRKNDQSQEQQHVIELPKNQKGDKLQKEENEIDGTLQSARPPSHTNPLFPPLPLYGPPSFLRDLQCAFFRFSSFFLSLAFLGVIVLGSLFTSIPLLCKKIFYKLTFRDLDKERPFYAEEIRRERVRKEKAQAWKKMHSSSAKESKADFPPDEYPPTEGGPDPIKCDSAGAYCCNDDASLAFWLCKSGYDVWLGNNRCGFTPRHVLLRYADPRMWCWNIRQMGVFSFLFDWTDERWDRGLRDRMFQFAPVYVSAESMRWWLGRECFAQHKCILATKEDVREEDRMDEEYDRSSSKIIPEYEHLDVIWAMDAPDQVFKEVREVLWKTCEYRDICRVPTGCEEL